MLKSGFSHSSGSRSETSCKPATERSVSEAGWMDSLSRDLPRWSPTEAPPACSSAEGKPGLRCEGGEVSRSTTSRGGMLNFGRRLISVATLVASVACAGAAAGGSALVPPRAPSGADASRPCGLRLHPPVRGSSRSGSRPEVEPSVVGWPGGWRSARCFAGTGAGSPVCKATRATASSRWRSTGRRGPVEHGRHLWVPRPRSRKGRV